MNTETIPIQRTGGHLRVGILGVALGVVLGATGTALAIDSHTSTTPAAVVREDDTAERSTQMESHALNADTAERWAQVQAATMSGDPFVSADTAERSAQVQAATVSGDPFVSADTAERSAD